MAAKIPNDIFQFSTTGALQAGFTGQGPIVHHLQGYGSHGLGAIAGTDDELIFLDSQAYKFHSKDNLKGKHLAKTASGDEGLAFVMVTKFLPEYQITVNGHFERNSVMDVIGSQGGDAGGKNSFVPFRIRGSFARVKIAKNNALRRHQEPLKQTETQDDLIDVKGTVFGFAGPEFFSGVSVTGAHCFFLSDRDDNGERRGGAFVDFETNGQAEVSWAVTGRYHLGFPRGDTWENLSIKSAEQASS